MHCVTSLSRDNATWGLGNEYKVTVLTVSNRSHGDDDDDEDDDDGEDDDDDHDGHHY